jgi:hypothetical protein
MRLREETAISWLQSNEQPRRKRYVHAEEKREINIGAEIK